jgi:hypothetical protein
VGEGRHRSRRRITSDRAPSGRQTRIGRIQEWSTSTRHPPKPTLSPPGAQGQAGRSHWQTPGCAHSLWCLRRHVHGPDVRARTTRARLHPRFRFRLCPVGVYGFLAGTWPFGVVEAIWAVIALIALAYHVHTRSRPLNEYGHRGQVPSFRPRRNHEKITIFASGRWFAVVPEGDLVEPWSTKNACKWCVLVRDGERALRDSNSRPSVP